MLALLCSETDRVLLAGSDAELEMKRVGGEPGSDLLGPFHGHAPGADEKIGQEEVFDLLGVFETIGVEVQEVGRAAMKRVDAEGWACHRFADTEAAREALHESGFADAEVAVKGERGVGWERGGELGGEGARLVGGRRDRTGAEFIGDARSHDSRRAGERCAERRRAGQSGRCA